MFLIYAFRHNGIVPYAAVLLLFVWITLRYFAQVRRRLIGVFLVTIQPGLSSTVAR